MIDAAAAIPAEQFRQIDHELAEYGAGLDERRQVVVLNKVDLLPGAAAARASRTSGSSASSTSRPRPAPGSRTSSASCSSSARRSPPPQADPEGLAEFLVYRPQPRAPTFRILRTDRGLPRLGTPPPPDELEAALRAAGARSGSEVEVGDETLVIE